jgi:AraC-like DNA-binding protein
MWRVVTHIDHHFAQGVTLRQASTMVDLHPDYLSRRFKQEMGIGFHQYVMTLRLQLAAAFLIDSTKSIKEISYDVGFRTPEVFSKAFKRLLGCSPTVYRIHHLPSDGSCGSNLDRACWLTSSRPFRDDEWTDRDELTADSLDEPPCGPD